MSFSSFSLLRQLRASLRGDSPPPPLLRPASLLAAGKSSYADELDPQHSAPNTPLPHEDFSYNNSDSALRSTPHDGTFATFHSTPPKADVSMPLQHASASILLTSMSAARPERAATVPIGRLGTPVTPGAAASSMLVSPSPSSPLASSDSTVSASASFSSSPSTAQSQPAASLSSASTFSSLPLHAPALPSLSPEPPPSPPPRPPRLHPPALQVSLLLAYCRAWLLANEEYEVRARLNDTASDKHALKVRVHQRMQRMGGEEKRIAVLLEGLSSQEEQLRRELDTLSQLMQHKQRGGAQRSRRTQPSPSSSPSPRTPSTANASLNALREQKHVVCSSIEQLIHKRNTHRQQLAVLQSSIACMTQALYQTHIAVRERYTQISERLDDELLPSRGGAGEIDTLAIEETPRKPITASMVEASPGSRISLHRNPRSLTASVYTSPQAPSSPRAEMQQSGVRFVSSVDEWVLSSVGRLRELRDTEERLEKRLTKLSSSRGQLASYFDRIQQYTRRQQHQPIARSTPDHKLTPPDADTSSLASLVRGWSLRSLATSDEADSERRRQEMEHVTALVYEHRNRKVLHRILQHVDQTQLPTTRRVKGQLHAHCIRGDELVMWFAKSNLLPSKVDALELIEMMLRGRLLLNVGRDESQSEADSDDDERAEEWDSADSFASAQLRHSLFTFASPHSASLDDLTRAGWLSKHNRHRSYARYFVWDTDLRRLAYYESSRDAEPIRIYWVDEGTVVHSLDGRMQAESMREKGTPISDSKGGSGADGQFYFELTFAREQHGETSLLLAADSEADRREWLRVLELAFNQSDAKLTKLADEQRRSSGGLERARSIGRHNRVALPPSMSFTTDSSIFPSLSLPLDPHAFTSAHSSLPSSHSASSTALPDGEEELLGELSVFDRKREQLRLSEFSVSRAKTAMVLHSSISHLEAKHDRELGLVDILNDEHTAAGEHDTASDTSSEDDQPGRMETPVKGRRVKGEDGRQGAAEGVDAASKAADEEFDRDIYDFEEEDDEADADDEAADSEDDDIIPGQLPAQPRSHIDNAYVALRKQQRRLKTIRAIRHLSSLLQERSSAPLARLLNVFVKLFRSLYTHALEVESDSSRTAATVATSALSTALNTPLGSSLYSSNSFNFSIGIGSIDALPLHPRDSRAQSTFIGKAAAPASPFRNATQLSPSATPSSASSYSSALSSPSSASTSSGLSPPVSLSYYSLYPRYVRAVVKAAKEDIDSFLHQLLRILAAHLQPDPFQADSTLQSLLAGGPTTAGAALYIPSSTFIAGAEANSVLSPVHSSPLSAASHANSASFQFGGQPDSATLLRERNKDVQSMLSACHRVLHRWLFGRLHGVVLSLYRVKHAQRDVQAGEKMSGLRDVEFEQFGLSSELLLPGMKRRQQQQPRQPDESGEEQRKAGGAGSLDDELDAAERERDHGASGDSLAGEGIDLDASTAGPLPALDLSLTSCPASPSASASTSDPVPYHYALSLLRGLPSIADPYDALSCVLKVARAICRSVDEARGGQAVVINADDLLLLFTYLLIANTNDERDGEAGGACWHAQLALMSDYLTDKQRCMLRGYYLATMQAALELVMTDDFAPIGVHAQLDEAAATTAFGDALNASDVSGLESPSSVSLSSVGSGSVDGSGSGSAELAAAEDDYTGELVVIVQ